MGKRFMAALAMVWAVALAVAGTKVSEFKEVTSLRTNDYFMVAQPDLGTNAKIAALYTPFGGAMDYRVQTNLVAATGAVASVVRPWQGEWDAAWAFSQMADVQPYGAAGFGVFATASGLGHETNSLAITNHELTMVKDHGTNVGEVYLIATNRIPITRAELVHVYRGTETNINRNYTSSDVIAIQTSHMHDGTSIRLADWTMHLVFGIGYVACTVWTNGFGTTYAGEASVGRFGSLVFDTGDDYIPGRLSTNVVYRSGFRRVNENTIEVYHATRSRFWTLDAFTNFWNSGSNIWLELGGGAFDGNGNLGSRVHVHGFAYGSGVQDDLPGYGSYVSAAGVASNAFVGRLTGDGPGLTGLNASALASGQVPVERLTNSLPSWFAQYGTNFGLIAYGDSTTAGGAGTPSRGWTNGWFNQLTNMAPWNRMAAYNYSTGGAGVLQLSNGYSGTIHPLRRAVTGREAMVFLNIGINDYAGSTVESNFTAAYNYLVTNLVADGFKVCVMTPFWSATTTPAQMTNAVRWSAFMLGQTNVDFKVCTQLFPAPGFGTEHSEYWVDGVHPDVAGAAEYAKFVDSILRCGPNNFASFNMPRWVEWNNSYQLWAGGALTNGKSGTLMAAVANNGDWSVGSLIASGAMTGNSHVRAGASSWFYWNGGGVLKSAGANQINLYGLNERPLFWLNFGNGLSTTAPTLNVTTGTVPRITVCAAVDAGNPAHFTVTSNLTVGGVIGATNGYYRMDTTSASVLSNVVLTITASTNPWFGVYKGIPRIVATNSNAGYQEFTNGAWAAFTP